MGSQVDSAILGLCIPIALLCWLFAGLAAWRYHVSSPSHVLCLLFIIFAFVAGFLLCLFSAALTRTQGRTWETCVLAVFSLLVFGLSAASLATIVACQVDDDPDKYLWPLAIVSAVLSLIGAAIFAVGACHHCTAPSSS